MRGTSAAALAALQGSSRGRRLSRTPDGKYYIERCVAAQQVVREILTAFDLAYEVALIQRLSKVFPEREGSVAEAVRFVVGKHCGLLRAQRKSLKLSVAEASVRAGVPPRVLYSVESGDLACVSIEDIWAVLRVCAQGQVG